jgi:hypothetical protein
MERGASAKATGAGFLRTACGRMCKAVTAASRFRSPTDGGSSEGAASRFSPFLASAFGAGKSSNSDILD